jgi:hypothetical protein
MRMGIIRFWGNNLGDNWSGNLGVTGISWIT